MVVLLIQCVKLPLNTTGTLVPIIPDEGLIDIVQAEPYAPLHIRSATANRGLRLVTPEIQDE